MTFFPPVNNLDRLSENHDWNILSAGAAVAVFAGGLIRLHNFPISAAGACLLCPCVLVLISSLIYQTIAAEK